MNFPEKQYLTIPFKLLEGVAREKTLEHIIKERGSLADARAALHEVDFLPSEMIDVPWESTGVKISGMKPMRSGISGTKIRTPLSRFLEESKEN